MAAAAADIARSALDPRQFRNVMGSFGTGVSILTAVDGGAEFGMTVNSLTSVSLDPCLLLVCTKDGSGTGEAIKRSGRFGISILGLHQKDVCRAFGGSRTQRWPDVVPAWVDGVPLVTGALAGLVCDLHQAVAAGDHEILIGRVTACEARAGAPLVFFRGAFGGFDEHALFPETRVEAH